MKNEGETVMRSLLRDIGRELAKGLADVGVICESKPMESNGLDGFVLRLAHRSIAVFANGTLDNPNVGYASFEWGLLQGGDVRTSDPLRLEYKTVRGELTMTDGSQ